MQRIRKAIAKKVAVVFIGDVDDSHPLVINLRLCTLAWSRGTYVQSTDGYAAVYQSIRSPFDDQSTVEILAPLVKYPRIQGS